MSFATFAFALAVAVGSGAVQDVSPGRSPQGQDPVVELPEVVVEGELPEALAREFIDQVAAPPSGATVARWHDQVCVGVVNLRPETARFLIDRVESVAADLGLRPERPGCRPDVLIVATVDGSTVARGLVQRRRSVLAPGNAIQSRSRGELETFANRDRPVRWWHISTSVDPATGRDVVRNRRRETFDATKTIDLIRSGPVVAGTIPSLITSSLRQDLRRAVLIIDFDRIADVDFNQLADYVAFVALAQVDPDADTAGFATILNVFDDPTTPGLTEWDLAYLQGLYRSDDRARTASARDGAIRREMLRARAGQAAEGD